MVLARLLDPEDFGLFATALLFTELVYFFDQGILDALGKFSDPEVEHIGAVFWTNVVVVFFWVLKIAE